MQTNFRLSEVQSQSVRRAAPMNFTENTQATTTVHIADLVGCGIHKLWSCYEREEST